MTPAASLALAVLAATGAVLVAAVAATRSKSPLAGPLALLSLDQFTWNAATVGLLLSGDEGWRWLGAAAAPLFPAMVLHFVLVFVGKRRALQKWLWLAYAVFSAEAVGVAVSALSARGAPTQGISVWAGVLAVTVLPLGVGGFTLVVRHLRAAPTPLERLRSWLLLASLVVLTASVMSDLLHDMGFGVPALSQTGSFLFTGAIALLAFRMGLLPEKGGVRSGLFALLVALLGAAVALLAFVVLQGHLALLALALGSLTLAATVVARRVTLTVATQRAGLSRFANVGRFSAQMAHDLKNPLAAARMALDFLEEERRQGHGLEAHAHLLSLVGEQLARMTRTIDRYQRLASVEPSRALLALDELVRKVLSLQAFAGEVQVDVPSTLPKLEADEDLLGTALDNLVKNAHEALKDGKGVIRVRAEVDELPSGDAVTLSVTDSGAGMDARAREQAFEPFFTTKATGSGLGLPWVKQVVEAHGGVVRLTSEEGKGTTVALTLPLRAVSP